ncbi:hypothetical protein [Burkholderia plantarii]|uniref:hypothetical protein n=1 Tax=Burkholderia plantarii TaxID=41899 RepID=UPI0018DD6C1F|nr:hypothetical protein [Burkholderia plantarii]MBI0330122.1 hypothetical protein [Burkholderia plantarii]
MDRSPAGSGDEKVSVLNSADIIRDSLPIRDRLRRNCTANAQWPHSSGDSAVALDISRESVASIIDENDGRSGRLPIGPAMADGVSNVIANAVRDVLASALVKASRPAGCRVSMHAPNANERFIEDYRGTRRGF